MTVGSPAPEKSDRSRSAHIIPTWLPALLFVAAVALLGVFRPYPLQNAENRIYDILIGLRPPGPATPNVVVAAIDEASLARYGQWPWSRTQMAKLLRSIVSLEPASVALDIIFAEADRTTDTPEDRDTRRQLATSGIFPQEGKDRLNDRMLASTLAAGPFCLGYSFRFDGKESSPAENYLHPLPSIILMPESQSSVPLYTATGVTHNRLLFSSAVRSSGFVNATPEHDGVIRRLPVAIRYRDQIYPSLAVAAVIQTLKRPRVDLTIDEEGMKELRFGPHTVPLDRHGNLLIDFRAASQQAIVVQATDFLDGRVPREMIAGKTVLVGTTVHTIEKPVTTPLGNLLSGVELHALVIQNLLNGRGIAHPPFEHLLQLTSILAAGAFGYYAFRRMRPLTGAACMVASVGITAAGSILLITGSGIFFSPLLPILSLGGLYPIIVLQKYQSKEQENTEHKTECFMMHEFLAHALFSLASIHDEETGTHLMRTQRYLRILAEEMSRHPRFSHFLTTDNIDLLVRMAPLHDIGKIGIPDRFLRKTGTLTKDEFEVVKKHTTIGVEAIQSAQERVGIRTEDLEVAKQLVLTHHEWWNGKGYPSGISGEGIPLPGRLMAVVDVYDALISRRRYKEPMSHAEACAIIEAGGGTQFDPAVVEGFKVCAPILEKVSLSEPEENQKYH